MTRLLLAFAVVFASPLPALAIFYGDDDYVEIDQIPDGSEVNWKQIARSVAVIVPDPGEGPYVLSDLKSMRSRYRNPALEPDYPYGEQPSLARLTAFLVGPDKIMTAGIRQLERSAFLFDFTWDSAKKRLKKSNYEYEEIFRCKKILLHRNDKLGDFAICQLDKPVRGRQPLTLQIIEDAASIDMLPAKMISAPDGTPLKLTNHGVIHGKRPTKRSPELVTTSFFFHTLDNSGGSSGAPIFNAKTGHVIGIQSGGDDNFTRQDRFVVPTRGDFEKSNLGRPLRGEWGSLIPAKALPLVKEE